jgi:drug/metabolite transporter (DMT)-like permease
MPRFVTVAWTTAAMVAFAANSLLCRQALGRAAIDPATYSSLRLASGALTLVLLAAALRRVRPQDLRPRWPAALALVSYVVLFSFAYLTLSAGTGALILFGAVQLTMFSAALLRGERLGALGWIGFALALAGLTYLLLPGLSAPPVAGALMMAVAGLAWGLYSLYGRDGCDPVVATARNFVAALPIGLIASLLFVNQFHASIAGAGLAIASGALASGAGYVAWYAALRGLSASMAATVQLSVPAIAAAGGVAWLGEPLTLRLAVAGALTLGGIAMALRDPRRSAAATRAMGSQAEESAEARGAGFPRV